MSKLHKLASSPLVMRLGLFMGQRTPEALGRRASQWAAGVVSWFKPEPYRILRANLSQVLGPDADRQTLDRTARQVFFHFLKGYYDLFHTLRRPREEILGLIDVAESTREVVQNAADQGKGLLLVFGHMGNFDLVGQVAASFFPRAQVLSLPDPPAGFRRLNELRREGGAEVTPLSPAALRQAIRMLKSGGTVAVAGDRPVSELDKLVSFFGRPARVPSAHVRLALRTGVDIAIGACVLAPETGRYHLHLRPPLEMVRTGDQHEDLQLNMRRVLDSLEDVIRRWPEQWQMFVPVWPDLQGG